MKCDSCGAAMRPDLKQGIFICDYCGAQYVPPPDSDGVLVLAESSQLCPVCARNLTDAALEMHTLKYCTNCHGMLIEMVRFVDLVETLRSHRGMVATHIEPRSPLDADRHLRCPSCQSVMEGYPYGGGGNVNVDSCERCGLLWLDRGELRRISSSR
jgi:Zn-finger nucleic acid-binding protein